MSKPGQSHLKELEIAAEWWTNYFRQLLKDHKHLVDTNGCNLSLIPSLFTAALAERERLEVQKEYKSIGLRSKLNSNLKYEKKSLSYLNSSGAPTIFQALEYFKIYLVEELRKKYDGHWYPTCRKRGHAYRCIKVDLQTSFLDSILLRAARRSMIASVILKVLNYRTGEQREETVMFVNPGEVKLVRISPGNSRNVKYIYESPDIFFSRSNEFLWDIENTSEKPVSLNIPVKCRENHQNILREETSELDETRSLSPLSCTTSSAGSAPAHSIQPFGVKVLGTFNHSQVCPGLISRKYHPNWRLGADKTAQKIPTKMSLSVSSVPPGF